MARRSMRRNRLDAALEEIARLGVEGLRLRWQALYGTPAPPSLRARLLQAGLAYKLQEQVWGGLKPSTRTLLRRAAEQADRPDRLRGRRRNNMGEIAALPGSAAVIAGSGPHPDRVQDDDRAADADAPPTTRVRSAPLRIKPGTRLLRSWQGTTHEVLVGDAGVTYRGETYRSLSEVARLITGQRWSGPLFFGMKRRSQHASA